MPLYDYACKRCKLTFEVSRSFKDADLGADCPQCGKPAKRELSIPMTYTKGAAIQSLNAEQSRADKAVAGKWSHGGHSHGAGVSGHSHGMPKAPKSTSTTPAAE